MSSQGVGDKPNHFSAPETGSLRPKGGSVLPKFCDLKNHDGPSAPKGAGSWVGAAGAEHVFHSLELEQDPEPGSPIRDVFLGEASKKNKPNASSALQRSGSWHAQISDAVRDVLDRQRSRSAERPKRNEQSVKPAIQNAVDRPLPAPPNAPGRGDLDESDEADQPGSRSPSSIPHPLARSSWSSTWDTQSNASGDDSSDDKTRLQALDGLGPDLDLDIEQFSCVDSNESVEENKPRQPQPSAGTPDRLRWLSQDWENNRGSAGPALNEFPDGRFVLDEDLERSVKPSAPKKMDRAASVKRDEGKRSHLSASLAASRQSKIEGAEKDPKSGSSSLQTLHEFLEGDLLDEEKEKSSAVAPASPKTGKHEPKQSWFARTKLALSRRSHNTTRPQPKTIVRENMGSQQADASSSAAKLSPKLSPSHPALPGSVDAAKNPFRIAEVEENKDLLKDPLYQRLVRLIERSKGVATIVLMNLCGNSEPLCSSNTLRKLKQEKFVGEDGLPVDPKKLVECFNFWCAKTVQDYFQTTRLELQEDALEDLYNRCLFSNSESVNSKKFKKNLQLCYLMTRERPPRLVMKEKIKEIAEKFYSISR